MLLFYNIRSLECSASVVPQEIRNSDSDNGRSWWIPLKYLLPWGAIAARLRYILIISTARCAAAKILDFKSSTTLRVSTRMQSPKKMWFLFVALAVTTRWTTSSMLWEISAMKTMEERLARSSKNTPGSTAASAARSSEPSTEHGRTTHINLWLVRPLYLPKYFTNVLLSAKMWPQLARRRTSDPYLHETLWFLWYSRTLNTILPTYFKLLFQSVVQIY